MAGLLHVTLDLSCHICLISIIWYAAFFFLKISLTIGQLSCFHTHGSNFDNLRYKHNPNRKGGAKQKQTTQKKKKHVK